MTAQLINKQRQS